MFRTFLLIGASAIALSATGAKALTTFSFTGTAANYTAAAGIYAVSAVGASGGGTGNRSGGNGASVSARVTLAAGSTLRVLVGGQGGSGGTGASGGGGGSFIFSGGSTPLLVAGGGGGGSYSGLFSANGVAASLGTGGSRGGGSRFGYGPTGGFGGHGGGGGQGGFATNGNGGGGGGVYGRGGTSRFYRSGGGGSGPAYFQGGFGSGGGGGGGFGGGGGGGHYSGGGGGGYSGGGGGANAGGGGGGGSFTVAGATNAASAIAASGGNGSATIDALRYFADPTLSVTALDFGAVRTDAAPVMRKLTIVNTVVAGPISDSLLATGGTLPSHVTTNFTSGPLAPGRSQVITYTLATAQSGNVASNVAFGFTSHSAHDTDFALASQNVSFTGKVYAPAVATLANSSVAFGATRTGTSVTRTVDITNTATGGLTDTLTTTVAPPAGMTGAAPGALAAGTSGNVSLTIGGTAGTFSGNTTLGFTSTDADLAPLTLGSRIIAYSGKVYAAAVASFDTVALNFGSTRVGTTIARSVTITNTATGALADTLLASGGAPAGVASTGAAMTLAQGASGTAIFTIGSVAGIVNATAVYTLSSHDADLADLALAAQNVSFTGKVYAPAVATLANSSVAFGAVRQNSVATQQVALTNSATGALTDVLVTTLGGGSAGVAVALPPALAGGQSGGIGFTLATATSGIVTGTATLGFASHDGDLADDVLPGATIAFSGTVTAAAAASILTTGSGLLTFANGVYVLDLGDITAKSGPLSTVFSVANTVAASAFAETLGGSFTGLSGGGFSFTGGGFAGIGGGTQSIFGTLGFDRTGLTAGLHSQVIDFTAFSRFAGLADLGLGGSQITVRANVIASVPEPATWGLLTGGFGMIGAAMRRGGRRRKTRLA